MVSIRFRIVYESYTIVNESYTIGVRLGSIRFRIVYDSYTIVYDWHTVGIRLVSIRVSFLKLSKKQRIRAAAPAPAGGLRKFSTRRPPVRESILEIAKIQHSFQTGIAVVYDRIRIGMREIQLSESLKWNFQLSDSLNWEFQLSDSLNWEFQLSELGLGPKL